LSHSTGPCVGYFWNRVSQTFSPGWLRTLILLISSSSIARITGVSHRCLALNSFQYQVQRVKLIIILSLWPILLLICKSKPFLLFYFLRFIPIAHLNFFPYAVGSHSFFLFWLQFISFPYPPFPFFLSFNTGIWIMLCTWPHLQPSFFFCFSSLLLLLVVVVVVVVVVVLGIELRALCLLSWCSITWATPLGHKQSL
jgi:hypothetical protein